MKMILDLRVLMVLAFSFAVPFCVRAAEMKTDLDYAANIRLLATHFAGYGYYPKQCIMIPPKGTSIRFYLPAVEKGAQTGLYSHGSLAGNFEVSAAYSWDDVPTPEKGYGASCGIAVEAVGSRKSVSVARGFLLGKGQGNGYVVVRGDPAAEKDKYVLEHFSATKATGGRLVLRREGTDVICLAGDGMQSELRELRELCRIPIGEGTIRPVRLFADTGGSPTYLDARLGFIRLHADEIAFGTVQHDQSSTLGWWLGGGALAALVAGFVFMRWNSQKEGDSKRTRATAKTTSPMPKTASTTPKVTSAAPKATSAPSKATSVAPKTPSAAPKTTSQTTAVKRLPPRPPRP